MKGKMIKTKQNKKATRAQLKIQQTAFMLLALVFFFSLIFIFYLNFSKNKLYEARNELAMQEAYTLLQKFSSNPEFSCLDLSYCLDKDKLNALENMSGKYKDYFSGLASVFVREIYPENKTFIIYENPNIKPEDTIIGYSAFIPLCSQRFKDGYSWNECKIAKFVVSMKEFKQA